MKHNLNLIDRLFLLALDDEKGSFVHQSIVFGYCMAGALLYELSVQEHISITDEKVRVTNPRSTKDEALDYTLSLIGDSSKERSVKYWVDKLGHRESKIRKLVLQKLISNGLVEEKENKILWVFTSRKYPAVNAKPENEIRKRLHDIILRKTHATVDEIMLISLVDSSGLNKEVYGKEMAKTHKKDIKKLIKEYPFATETSQLIKEIHDTLLAVLIIVMASSTITTATT